MREMIEVHGGGLKDGRKLKAVIPGGLSAPVLTAEMVDKCTLDYESLASLGSMLGSGGITVLDETAAPTNGANKPSAPRADLVIVDSSL